MNPPNSHAHTALQNAKQALRTGDKRTARRWAEKAIVLAPDWEESWLLLAALASPRASIAYLKQALEVNPQSQRARKGMHWAVNRIRSAPQKEKPQRQIVNPKITPRAFIQHRPAVLPWAIVFSLFTIGCLLWFSTPTLSLALSPLNALPLAQSNIEKSTYTPTPSATFTSTPTFTPTLTPTNTPTDTPTPTPTSTATNTSTPLPTITPIPPQVENNPNPNVSLPPGVNKGDRWIDIDLTNQRVYAYQGKNLVNSFITSTGTWQHPTVTGHYKVYVKYRYADMSGPGYYLPSVPYVMYFYKGYGVHGTYWHNNFGTPMSHGCVNLRTEDAGWVFNWSSIGTIVNIHY